ncbi:MAG: sigma-70 family RNA polymerase sigma factor [Planctomycetota bacterium]
MAMTNENSSDWDLVARYIAGRDEAAFAEIVRRHGPLVAGVARRILGSAEDAEDVFQATFLILARKAAAIRRQESLPGWLSRVAYHSALRVRRRRAARVEAEKQVMRNTSHAGEMDRVGLDIAPVLDEEMNRLPEKYRAPVVLCLVENRTHELASREVGVNLPAFRKRLGKAREMLRARLARRGVVVSVAILGTWMAEQARASVPDGWVKTALKNSSGSLPGAVLASGASEGALTIMEDVMKMMMWRKIGAIAASVLVVVGLAGGGIWTAASLARDGGGEVTPAAEEAKAFAAMKEAKAFAARNNPAPDGKLKALAAGNNRFAGELYGKLKTEKGNLFFSPFSLRTALAMTHAGARGTTAEEMRKTLELDLVEYFPEDRLAAAFEGTLKSLDTAGKSDKEKGHDLLIVNALWGQEGYKFLDPFLTVCRDRFGGGLNLVDFVKNTEGARQTINRWVEGKTRDRIKDLIPPGVLTDLTKLVLTNAVWFKGMWEVEFEKTLTKNAPFTTAEGKVVRADMMNFKETGKWRYLEDDAVQILEIPYRGKAVSMVVILPRGKDGLPDVEAWLPVRLVGDGRTRGQWDCLAGWLDALDKGYDRDVIVSLPKFKMTWGTKELKEALASLGMKEAFVVGKADFSGINGIRPPADEALFIGNVLHKAFVEVNEEGTEAAVATAVMKRMRMPEPVFIADHPFIFLIREKAAGNILFLGRVADPTKN